MSNLFEPRGAYLSTAELESAFGDEIKIQHSESSILCTLSAKASPYGGALPVTYLDPYIPVEPDGSVTDDRIKLAQLFNGGWCIDDVLGAIFAPLSSITSSVVTGFYFHGKFRVSKQGVDSTDDYLLILCKYHADDLRHHSAILKLKETALFFATIHITETGFLSEHDVLVLKYDQAFTRNGRPKESSLRHYQYCDIIEQRQHRIFAQQFCHPVIQDDVMYADAWVINQIGLSLPPDCTIKEWFYDYDCDHKLWRDLAGGKICVGCSTGLDGQTTIECQAAHWRLNDVNQVTKMQRRRLIIIYRKIIKRIKKIFANSNFAGLEPPLPKFYLILSDNEKIDLGSLPLDWFS